MRNDYALTHVSLREGRKDEGASWVVDIIDYNYDVLLTVHLRAWDRMVHEIKCQRKEIVK